MRLYFRRVALRRHPGVIFHIYSLSKSSILKLRKIFFSFITVDYPKQNENKTVLFSTAAREKKQCCQNFAFVIDNGPIHEHPQFLWISEGVVVAEHL